MLNTAPLECKDSALCNALCDVLRLNSPISALENIAQLNWKNAGNAEFHRL